MVAAGLHVDGTTPLPHPAYRRCLPTATGAGAKTLTLQGSSSFANSVLTIVDNSAVNTTSVTKAGTGFWILNGASTYTGVTTVTDGVLNIRNNASLGSVVGGTTIASGGTLQIESLAGLTIGAEAMTISGAGFAGQVPP